MTDKIFIAKEFCVRVHGVQMRKYTGEAYFHHPFRVAELVRQAGFIDNREELKTDDVYISALLHDVLEDTLTGEFDIQNLFGNHVLSMVKTLTDVPRTAGNRKLRAELNSIRLGEANFETKSIKLADIIDNFSSIVEHDPFFAVVWVSEKRQIYDKIKNNCSKFLSNKFERLLVNYKY